MAIILLGVAAPGSMGASQLPVALSGTMPGGGYVVAKIDYEGGGPVELSIATPGCEGGCAFGGSLLGPDGYELSSIFVSRGVLGNQDCVIAGSPDLSIDGAECDPSTAQHIFYQAARNVGPGGIRFWDTIDAAEGDPLGVWTLIVWIAFEPNEQSATSWSLSFDPAVASVRGVTTGDRAWYASAQDFQGGTALVLSRAGAFVSAHTSSHLNVDVQNRLFGMMSTDSIGSTSPAGGLTFRGPFGAQTCTCMLWDLDGSNMVGPGSYDLSLNRVAGGHQAFTDL
ncbi:MAG: hypothetical protein WDA16_01300, partial [Candidatus Thermoplasmatota archaeon]